MTDPLTTKRWTISLKHLNTDLTIALPLEYDTMLMWKETSCQCVSNKYRIQNKTFPIYFDGCCADNNVPYSKLQLTIEEPLYSLDPTNIQSNKEIEKKHRQEVLYSQNDPQMQQTQYDTILNYQNRTFYIFANISHNIKQGSFRQILTATVYVRGLPVKLSFEKSYSKLPLDRTIFINDCITTIKSVSTSNGT